KVQLTIDGVPTTLATTDVNGNFTTLGIDVPGATVKLEVTPPAGSGLSRLEATDMLDVGVSIDVSYAAKTLRSLQGVPVRRGGAALRRRRHGPRHRSGSDRRRVRRAVDRSEQRARAVREVRRHAALSLVPAAGGGLRHGRPDGDGQLEPGDRRECPGAVRRLH